jgi:hypothetical protein
VDDGNHYWKSGQRNPARQDPYRNLEERGVICAQINSLTAMYPKLDINNSVHGLSMIYAHAFPDQYAFLP